MGGASRRRDGVGADAGRVGRRWCPAFSCGDGELLQEYIILLWPTVWKIAWNIACKGTAFFRESQRCARVSCRKKFGSWCENRRKPRCTGRFRRAAEKSCLLARTDFESAKCLIISALMWRNALIFVFSFFFLSFFCSKITQTYILYYITIWLSTSFLIFAS